MLTNRFLALAGTFVLVFNVCVCLPFASARTGPYPDNIRKDIPVLLYHHIEPVQSSFNAQRRRWTMTPEKFESQIEWILRQGFAVITLKELFEARKKAIPLDGRTVVLTFDDGWKDHYARVFPILKKHGLKATFFIVANSVGNSSYMDWPEILEMESAGMDIQSHSLTHPKLTTIDRQQSWREISESKKILDGHLRKPVTIFAYPFGYYDQRIIQMVKDAGYQGAVTVSGLNAGYLTREDKAFTYIRYALEGRENLETVARIKKFYP